MTKPTEFSPELATEICARIMSGRSVREVCRDDDMPDRRRVYEWLAADADFAHQYARAMEVRADELADEMFEIADDGANDWMRRNGKEDAPGWTENGEAIRRSQLRIDTRKWALARMNPRKYGDKVQLGGAADLPPIQTEDISARERIASRLARIAAGTGSAGGSGGPDGS